MARKLNHKLTIGIVLLSFAIILSVMMLVSPKEQKEAESHSGLEIGTAEDPYARQTFEKMRLADPETGEIPENIAAREMAFSGMLPTHQSLVAQKKAGEWEQRGPHNIGGRTRAIALDVNDPDIILTGSVTGSVYRSEDGGSTWARANTPGNLNAITDIIQDTRDGKTDNWYFCTGEIIGNLMVYPGDGIYKSTDGGKSFQGLHIENKPQQYRNINYGWRMVLDHTRNDSDILYLAAWGSILRSNDAGETWKEVLGGRARSASRTGGDIAISEKGILYAALSSNTPNDGDGLWRSEDGLTWTNIKPLEFPITFGRVVLDIYKANENVVYFLGLTPNKGKYGSTHSGTEERNSLWRYEYLKGDGADSNGTWEDRTEQIPDLRQTDGYVWGDFVSQGGYNLVVRVHPTNEDQIVIGGTNLYASTDGFTTSDNTSWVGGYLKTKDRIDAFYNGLVYPNHHPDQHNLIFHPDDPDKAFSANDGGLQLTDNIWDQSKDVEWTSLNNGYYTTQFYTITLNQNPNDGYEMSDIMLGGFQDNETQYIHTDKAGNEDWTRIACCDGSYAAVFDNDDHTYVVASKQLGTMYMAKFQKDGTRVGAARIDPDGGGSYLFINPFVQNPTKPEELILAAGRFIWKNKNVSTIPLSGTDSKTTWNWFKFSETQTELGDLVTALDISTKPENIVYYGTQTGRVYRINEVNDDEGYELIDLNANGRLMNGQGYISSISIDPNNAEDVLVCFSNYNRQSVYFSSNGGASFRDVSGNLEENPDGKGAGPACHVVKIIRDQQNNPIYLVGTTSGLYSTIGLPGAATIWNRESTDLIGNCSVRDIDYRGHDGLLVVGTHGCGSFSTHIDKVASTPESEDLADFELYPNPAIDIVRYSINTGELVDIKVLGLDARVHLSLAQQPANGTLDLSDFAKGAYFLVLENDEVLLKKQFTVQ